MSKLIQIKIDPNTKKELDFIADYKGIPLTSLIKLNLKILIRKEKLEMFTINGLTEDQELEILQREKSAIKDYSKGKLKAKTGQNILKELNA